MRRLAWTLLLVAFAALAGCGVATPGLIPRNAVARIPDFPGCAESQAFLFAGETSLAAIGLDEFGAGPDAHRIGSVVVTADPVDLMGPVEPPQAVPPPTRAVCIQFEDGSGMAGPIPDDWQPPGAVTASVGAMGAEEEQLLGMLALLVGALVVIGVSWLAFRERRTI